MNVNNLIIENFEKQQLNLVIAKAARPEVKAITSLIIESDIRLLYENLNLYEPESIPGKISVILYNRFKKFEGNQHKGVSLITPFLPDTDVLKLEAFIIEVAHYNQFDPLFIDWIEQSNRFSNSIAD